MSPHQKIRSARPRAGFTLIEVMAVVAIIAMVFAIGVPQLGGRKWDILNTEAEFFAETLRFARQRAIMTGKPHRVLIDLEEGGYLIEWYVSEEKSVELSPGETGDEDFAAFGDPNLGEDGPAIDFFPPQRMERDYFPIPHRDMGNFRWLDDALYFVGVEGASGWVEGGDYPIVFYVDGTTESASIELADAEDNHITLEVEPLRERVSVRTGGARL